MISEELGSNIYINNNDKWIVDFWQNNRISVYLKISPVSYVRNKCDVPKNDNSQFIYHFSCFTFTLNMHIQLLNEALSFKQAG